MAFLSPAPDNGDGSQRVLGDFQQMVAVGNKFYGVFTGMVWTHRRQQRPDRFLSPP
jgi:hypothetical protein